MEGFDSRTEVNEQDLTQVADFADSTSTSDHNSGGSHGSSVQESDFEVALDQALEDPLLEDGSPESEHNHAKPESINNSLHTSLDAVDVKSIDLSRVRTTEKFGRRLARNGDLLDPGGGNNTVIGSKGDDVIVGTGGGLNTITVGGGKNTVVLGKETTNRIFDFNPRSDVLAFSEDLSLDNIVIAQGKNPTKGGIDQPLDSENNALIIDKETEHILAALTFVNADSLSVRNFSQVSSEALQNLEESGKFETTLQAGDGGEQLTGTRKSDRLTGGNGNDFLYVGDDGFRFGKARGNGPGEFPFPNNSPGVTEMNLDLKGGVLRVQGSYKNFEGLPLFSDGATEVDPDAVIPNGADPQALIEGFLRVPQDSEGNPISGFHVHFSPEGFADATVERYFTVNPTDEKSGQVTGEFELEPELQAALLGNVLYGNLHSTKHPVGENRVEFNTARFT
ncbi:hypothetical protein C7B61_07830 [filamentous cyanobacterium CCP1]|nr:hypothetical protein C7B61_07830 [filamentous cyanobacterium CCP1]